MSSVISTNILNDRIFKVGGLLTSPSLCGRIDLTDSGLLSWGQNDGKTRLAITVRRFRLTEMNANGTIKCAFCDWRTSNWPVMDAGMLVSDHDMLRFHVMTAHPYLWFEVQSWLDLVCLSEEELQRVQEYY